MQTQGRSTLLAPPFNRLPCDPHCSRIGRDDAGGDLQECRLATAARPYQSDSLSSARPEGGNLERELTGRILVSDVGKFDHKGKDSAATENDPFSRSRNSEGHHLSPKHLSNRELFTSPPVMLQTSVAALLSETK